jgi:Insertion element 4 transposase N-terminal
LPGQCVITREIAVAEGIFAPGHLGELTQIVPFEMVDAVLAECGATQRRLRKLPARVVVYLLLAAALFEECGYAAVWARLTAALGSLPLPGITATGLWHARARLGVRPLRAAAASSHNAGTVRIHPLAEIGISATVGQPCTRSEHVRRFFACLDGPDRPGSSHPFTA